MKKLVTLMFVLIFGLVLVGCEKELVLTSVSISGKTQIKVGSSEQYTATFQPAEYKDTVTWSTSDESALTIDQNGLATGVAARDTVYIYAQPSTSTTVKGQKKVVVKSDVVEKNYPDLQGYTIKIAQAEQALSDMDPFLDGYTQADKAAKQQAWEEVEENFNCQIEVVAYPSSAPWGPARWSYITTQASLGTADYDFYTVPDSQIATFVEAGALIDLSDFYVLYGNEMMDPSFKTSGSYQSKLYAVGNGDNNIYACMYYNVKLLEQLQEVDPTLKEPAQLWLDGQWSFEDFVAYCKQAQDALAQLKGSAGTALSDDQEWFAVSGWAPYWYAGLSTNDGEPLADTQTMTINLTTENKIAAAETVKTIYTSGYADPKQNVDGAVQSWNNGQSLFNTGDLWFVGDTSRWASNAWGDDTRYGYVPWPSVTRQSADDYQIAMGGTATWVMPIGRDYSGYGDECTAENIYYALATMLQLSEKYYVESDDYDEEAAIAAVAAKYAHSEASQAAYIKIQNLIKNGQGYFDPLCVPDNSIGSWYTSGTTLRSAVNDYCNGSMSWEAAVINLLPVLQEALRKAYS